MNETELQEIIDTLIRETEINGIIWSQNGQTLFEARETDFGHLIFSRSNNLDTGLQECRLTINNVLNIFDSSQVEFQICNDFINWLQNRI